MSSVSERVSDVDHGRANAAPENYDAIANNTHTDKTPTTSNVHQSPNNNNLAPRIIDISSSLSGSIIEAPSLSLESSSELLFEMGYDSDGFMPELENFFEDFDEEEILRTEPSTTAAPTAATDPTATAAASTATAAAPTTVNTAPTTAAAAATATITSTGAASFVLITDNKKSKSSQIFGLCISYFAH